jgi:hypothetical protein
MESFDAFAFIREYNRIQVDQPENCMIYHYTSADALLNILNTRTLWFSDRSYLNDRSEGLLPLELLEETITQLDIYEDMKAQLLKEIPRQKEKLIHGTKRAYILSFSIDPDNLCLWNYYTKGDQIQGYNIGFQADILTDAFHGIKPGKSNAYIPLQGRVIYNKNKQKEQVISTINSLLNVAHEQETDFTACFIIDKIIFLGYFFKTECFNIENEYRMVIIWDRAFQSEDYLLKEENYRIHNGFFIPYRQVPFSNNCIKAITVSPTIEYDLAHSSLKRALSNYPEVEIKRSSIPVRY